jgi:hypothetical protein
VERRRSVLIATSEELERGRSIAKRLPEITKSSSSLERDLMATRTYTVSGRSFNIVMPATQAGRDVGAWAWTVEHVFEAGEEVAIPGLDNVAASSEDQAFSLACARIDNWLAGPERA